MYYSDREMYAVAQERHRDMLDAAHSIRLASLYGKKSMGVHGALRVQFGAFLIHVGRRLQEKSSGM